MVSRAVGHAAIGRQPIGFLLIFQPLPDYLIILQHLLPESGRLPEQLLMKMIESALRLCLER